MKKILFNDKYGLTQAVLEGRKTQTRRIIKNKNMIARHWNPAFNADRCYYTDERGKCQLIDADTNKIIVPSYQIGEVVAVAQSYCAIAEELEDCNNATCAAHYEKNVQKASEYISWMYHPGFNNKLFVAADRMIHKIRITDVRIERLQDISDEDCLKEGVIKDTCKTYFNGYTTKFSIDQYGNMLSSNWFKTPREAFAHLINKVSRKDVWNENPYVFVYDFELVNSHSLR